MENNKQEPASDSQAQALQIKQKNIAIEELSCVPLHQKVQQLAIYEYQVSGKTPKYTNNTGYIYKQYSETEYYFYQSLQEIKAGDSRYSLKKYIPQYYGLSTQEIKGNTHEFKLQKNQKSPTKRNIWIDHISSRSKHDSQQNKKFICLKNKTHGYIMPNIIDLKLGIKKYKKSNDKFANTTTNSHKFRINGMMTALKRDEEYEECFVSKYHGQKLPVSQVEDYMSLFFFNGQHIDLKLLQNVIDQLTELIQFFNKFIGIKFISSSLFISYDATNSNKYVVNLIDFDKYETISEQQSDSIVGEGLTSILNFLNKIYKNYDSFESKLLKRQLQIFKHDHAVIPQHKIDEYSQK